MRPATEQRQRERAIASITLETDDDSVRRAITPTSPAVARRLAVGPRADHDQGAEPVIFEPDVEVHPVDPDVNVFAPGPYGRSPGPSAVANRARTRGFYAIL